MESIRFRRLVSLITLALVCAAASAAIWSGPGIVNTRGGGDSPFLLIRTYELAANLRAGVFPARWMPDAAYGLGYPFFNYYAALPYYLAAGLNVIGVDLLSAIKLTQTIGMFAASYAMLLFARTMVGRAGATLASCAYVLAPFHLVNVYVRGDALSEFWAFVWYPLILWAIKRLVDTSAASQAPGAMTPQPAAAAPLGSTLALSLSLAALVLTHNVSALLFAPFIVIYALVLIARHLRGNLSQGSGPVRLEANPPATDENRRPVQTLEPHASSPPLKARTGPLRRLVRVTGPLVLAAIFALLLSAWFWLPALAETPGAQLADQATGYFAYSNHFRSGNLVQATFMTDYAITGTLDAFAMGLVQALLAGLGGLAVLTGLFGARRGARRPVFDLVLMLAVCLIATVMLTPLSAPVWEHVPLLKLAQFPWRMLSVQAVFASLVIGAIPDISNWGTSPRTSPPTQSALWLAARWPALASALGIVLLTLSSLVQLPNDRLNILAQDVTPQAIHVYEWYTGNIGTTIRAEYLPSTARPRPYTGPDLLGQTPQALIAQDGVPPDAVSTTLVSQTPAQQVWRVTAKQTVRLTLPLLYSPVWRLGIPAVDCRAFASASDPSSPSSQSSAYAGSGWVQVVVPKGEQRVMVQQCGTNTQQAATSVSAFAVLVALALLMWTFVRSTRAIQRTVNDGIALVVIGVLAVRFIFPAPPPAASTSPAAVATPSMNAIDFQSRPFPHRGPLIFEGKGRRYELTGASITPSVVQAGQPFTLTLEWLGGQHPAVVEITQETPMGGEFTDLFRSDRQVTRQAGSVGPHATLKTALPGPQLIKLTAREREGDALLGAHDPGGHALTALISGQWTSGVTLLGPTVTALEAQAAGQPLVTFANGIALVAMDWFYSSAHSVCLRPEWRRVRSDINRADSLQVSLRLRGSDGRSLTQADAQPQAGFAPTWSWPERTNIRDSQCLPTDDRSHLLDAGEPYTIDIVWYRVNTLQPTGQASLHGTRSAGLNDLNVPQAPQTALAEGH